MDPSGSYSKSIIQQQPGGAIIKNNLSLICITMINPATGWFETVEVLTYYIVEVTNGNDEYIDNSSARVNQLFNNTYIIRYLSPRKVVFGNIYKFKRDLTPLLDYFDTKPVLTTI